MVATELAAAIIVQAQPGGLPRVAPDAAGLSSDQLQAATALLQRYVAETKIAGAVAGVARHGRLAYLTAVGVQDRAAGTAMTEDSLFRIYSMTKPVTAVAAMMLHEEGRFQLTDPVAKYLPEFARVVVQERPDGAARPPSRAITVADLLLHTSGLDHRTSARYRSAGVRSRAEPLPTFVANIVRVPLLEDPGTRYRYSEGTTVVGRLIEIWSGQPFDAFLAARVFGPLGMRDTSFWVAPEKAGRLASVYGPAPGGGLAAVEIEALPFTEPPALLEGAVGLVSTVPDFLRFAQMLLNGGELDGHRLLRAETVRTMTTNGLPDAVLRARAGGMMGWGWATSTLCSIRPASNTRRTPASTGWDGTAGPSSGSIRRPT